MYCKNCGSEISNNSQFCERCGFNQREINSNNVFRNNPNNQQIFLRRYQKNEPAITFIFIVSLVLMILLSIRTLSSLPAIASYQDLVDIVESGFFNSEANSAIAMLIGSAFFSLISLILTLTSVIILFVFASKVKNKKITIGKIKRAKAIFIIALIAMILCALYLISEIIIFACIQQINNLVSIEDIYILTGQLIGSITAVTAFTILLVVTFIKSITYLKYLKNEINNSIV